MSRHARVFDRRLPRVNPIKPPRDMQWPPPGVRDIGSHKHEERPVQFNKPRVKP